ncbi:Clp protease N-terminal domain-containing protein [Actinomadura sp. DC4]|nr:Clp protease N-terminal domain-containing protein [Actinomadura sp. DC4]
MPKINVYLPDDLAEAVKDSGVPVSAICQRALEQAVRRVNAIRAATLSDLGEEDLAARLPNFTERTRTALRLAVGQAREQGAPEVGTEHLLGGLLAEGTNLGVRALQVLEIQPEQLTRELARVAVPGDSGAEAGRRFSGPAANALELTATEAIGMQHNYIGCEHLLIALALEPDGAAGVALRAAGADARVLRRTVSAAVAGYAHLRAQTAAPEASGGADRRAMLSAAIRKEMEPLVRRIELLESSAEEKS